jgi:uncharacterized protein
MKLIAQLNSFPDRVERALSALAVLCFRRPVAVLLATAALTVLSALLASRLRLETDLSKLLPHSHESVRNAEELARRFGGSGNVVVLVSGAPAKDLERFADELAPKLEALPSVTYVEYRRADAFFERHALYYLDPPDLRALRDRVAARRDWEVAQSLDINLLDEPPPPIELADIEKKYRERFGLGPGEALGDLAGQGSGDGARYYHDTRHGRLALFVKPTQLASDLTFARAVVGDVDRVVASVDRAGYPAGLQVELTGRYAKRVDLQQLISSDLTRASLLSALLVAAYVAYHFRRASAVGLLLAPLAASLALSYGFAAVTIGSVNILTAFIGAILLGLGVDGGVHLLGRFDAERAAGYSPEEAVARTFGESGRASMAAALTNAGAFACLILADFKAFREFGILAAAGVVFTLLCYAVVLPALLGLRRRGGGHAPAGEALSMPGAGLVVRRAPWVFFTLSLLIAGAMTQLPRLRFNYDFGALDSADLRSFQLATESAGLHGRSQTPLVVLANSPADARAAASALRQRRAEHGAGSTIGRIVSLVDLVPEDQQAKAPLLGEIHRMLRRVSRARLPEAEQRRLDRAVAMADAKPFKREQLPEEVLRQFRDARGASVTDFVLVYPSVSMSDGRFARKIAEEVSDLDLGGGRKISAAGEPMVLADVLGSVLSELPWLVALALGQQILLLSVFLGGIRRAMLTLTPAFISIPLAGALMALLGLQLNYLNVILLPVLIGMGEDGVAHLIARLSGGDGLEESLGQTGRATIGSAVTTAAGFGALALAGHPGLRSVGQAAVLGVLANLVVSIALLPALLALLGPRRGLARAA